MVHAYAVHSLYFTPFFITVSDFLSSETCCRKHLLNKSTSNGRASSKPQHIQLECSYLGSMLHLYPLTLYLDYGKTLDIDVSVCLCVLCVLRHPLKHTMLLPSPAKRLCNVLSKPIYLRHHHECMVGVVGLVLSVTASYCVVIHKIGIIYIYF